MSTESSDSKLAERPARGVALLLTLLACLFVLYLARLAWTPPEPRGAEAPAEEFSAARAMDVLSPLVGEGLPRSLGSAAHERAREQLLEALAGLGFEPEVQEAVACSRWGNCARVFNVLAWLPGGGGEGAVALVAHYDSVDAGPGASDDGTGVAILLESARAMKTAAPPRHPVLFLFTDGEEAGLLGARAFAEQHPRAGEVKAVVNLDARGRTGPSLMFETSRGNAALLALYAGAVERPLTSSFFATIYEMLPNDTDFSVFKRRGGVGFNLAFLRDPLVYHRPTDTLAQVDPRSLQHQGEQALALVKALAETGPPPRSPRNAVFFDLLGLTTIAWGALVNLGLALSTVLLLVITLVLAARRGQLRVGGMVWGLLAWLAAVVGAGVLGAALDIGLGGAGAFPPARVIPWVANPQGLIAAFWGVGLFAALLPAALLGRAAGAWGLWAGSWIWWTLAAVVLALRLPGMSYLFLVPALLAALAGLVAALLGRRALAAAVPAVVAAALWFGLGLVLYDGLGSTGLPAVALVLAIFGTTLTPLVGELAGRWRWGLVALALVATLVGAVMALGATRFTEVEPRPLNLVFSQDGDAGTARWLAPAFDRAAVPYAVRQAGGLGQQLEPMEPWSRGRALAGEAPGPLLPAPEVMVLESVPAGQGRRVSLHLVSPRGAPVARLHWPPQAALTSLSIEGAGIELGDAPAPADDGERWRNVSYLTVPREGVQVDFTVAGQEPFELVVSDDSPGLPPQGAALKAARGTTGAPIHAGDRSLVHRTVAIGEWVEAPPADDAAGEDGETEAGEAAATQ